MGDSLQGVEKFLADMHQGDRGVESGVTDWSQVLGSGKVVSPAPKLAVEATLQPIRPASAMLVTTWRVE